MRVSLKRGGFGSADFPASWERRFQETQARGDRRADRATCRRRFVPLPWRFWLWRCVGPEVRPAVRPASVYTCGGWGTNGPVQIQFDRTSVGADKLPLIDIYTGLNPWKPPQKNIIDFFLFLDLENEVVNLWTKKSGIFNYKLIILSGKKSWFYAELNKTGRSLDSPNKSRFILLIFRHFSRKFTTSFWNCLHVSLPHGAFNAPSYFGDVLFTSENVILM